MCLHHLILLQGFFLFASIKIEVTDDHLIAEVVRVFVCQVLHFLKGTFLVVHLQEKAKLLHGELFTLTLLHFYLVQHLHHVGIVVLVFVEFKEHPQHLTLFREETCHILHILECLIGTPLFEIKRDKLVLVPIVLGIEFASELKGLNGKAVVLHIAVQLGEFVENCS